MSSGTLPPLEEPTPGNEGPFVVAFSYCLLVFAALATLVRVLVTWNQKRGFGLDGQLLVLALIFAIPQTVVTERAADSGLGRHMHNLTANQIATYYKYMYVSEIIAIIPMTFGKLSVVSLVSRIAGGRSVRRPCQISGVLCLVWGALSVFAIAFECGATKPWIYKQQRCKGDIWYGVVALNLATDLALATFFIPVLWKVQASVAMRLKVISLLGIRILLCAAEVVQLIYLGLSIHDTDQTRAKVNFTVLNQCIMTFSIILATSHMKLIYNDNKGTTGSSSHEMSRSASGNKKSKNYSILSRNRSTNDMDGREKCGAGKTLASGATGPFRSNGRGEGKAHVENDPSNADETGSRTSDGSEKMIIRQTVGWDVRYDDRH